MAVTCLVVILTILLPLLAVTHSGLAKEEGKRVEKDRWLLSQVTQLQGVLDKKVGQLTEQTAKVASDLLE